MAFDRDQIKKGGGSCGQRRVCRHVGLEISRPTRLFAEFLRKTMQTQQKEFMHWLQAMLTDEKLRAALRALLQQYELPVIEIGQTASR